jgi:undecaprenyl-diphosphatase
MERQSLAPANYISSQYTKTGFQQQHADIPVAVMLFTLVYALLRACFTVLID